MPLPGGLTAITVTGTFADGAGNPLGGTVTFWPSAEITDATGHVIIGMTPVTAVVSQSTGQFSQALIATDNAGLLPQGWTYKIQVAVAGAQQVFNAYIPSSYGSSVDLSVLGPVQPLPSLTGPFVVSVNGQSGQVTVMPQPSGTATAGYVPVATGSGEASAWGPQSGGGGGITPPAGDIGGTTSSPTVVSTHLSAALPVAQGGTGQVTAAAAIAALGALPVAGGTMTGALAPAVVPLTFATTITVNAALGNVFAVTLTASTGTLGAPSNPVDGQAIRVRVIQDATGGRTLAYASGTGGYDFGAAGQPSLSTTPNKVDILTFEYVASLTKWAYLGSGLGY